MLRDKHFHRDKQLLALNRESWTLHKERTVKVIIDPPIQRGWVRRWRLTKAAQSRPDAAVLLTILSGINTEVHFWRRSFKPGKGRKDRYRRHILTGQALRVLHEWEWYRLGWPTAWRHRYFREHEALSWSKQKVTILTFFLEGIFELYTDRHFVFQLPVLNAAAESRTAEIDSAIRRIGQFRLDWLMDLRRSRWPDRNLRQKELRQIHRRIMRRALRGEDVEVRRRLVTPVRFSVPNHTFFLTRASANMLGFLTFIQAMRVRIPPPLPFHHHTTASSNSLGLCALHTGIRVQLPVRLPFQSSNNFPPS